MLLLPVNLENLFTGFKTAFNSGLTSAPSTWQKVAMEVGSVTGEESYGWLAQLPAVREWIGDRIIHNLLTHGYTIKNRTFELTIGVDRNDMEDDKAGLLAPLFETMGREGGDFIEKLVYELLASGFAELCYDGKPFFSEEHPVGDDVHSNVNVGTGPAWYLFDASRPIKPLIFQNRRPFQLVRRDNPTDEGVFNRREYRYEALAE